MLAYESLGKLGKIIKLKFQLYILLTERNFDFLYFKRIKKDKLCSIVDYIFPFNDQDDMFRKKKNLFIQQHIKCAFLEEIFFLIKIN